MSAVIIFIITPKEMIFLAKDNCMTLTKKFNLVSFLALGVLIGCASSGGYKDKTDEQKKADLYYEYGSQSLMDKKYTQALDHLLKARSYDSKNTKIENNLAMAYYFKGDIKKSLEHLKRSIEIDNKNSDAKNNLASIYFHQNKISEAKKVYQEISKDLVYEGQFRVQYSLGLIAESEGDLEKAESFFAQSIKENGEYCPAHYALGKIAFKERDYGKAIGHFKNAYAGTCTNEALPHLATAECYYKLGDYLRAKRKYLEFVEKFPKHPSLAEAKRKIDQIPAVEASDKSYGAPTQKKKELSALEDDQDESMSTRNVDF